MNIEHFEFQLKQATAEHIRKLILTAYAAITSHAESEEPLREFATGLTLCKDVEEALGIIAKRVFQGNGDNGRTE